MPQLATYVKVRAEPTGVSAATRPFTGKDIRNIYQFPAVPTTPVVVGVVTFGGFLSGTIDANGILTGGGIQQYWTSLGMTSLPTVKVVTIGSTFDYSDFNSAIENSIDVQMIGACCPTSNLTIVLYYCNQWSYNGDAFSAVFNAAINSPLKPSIISCSWGAPESAFGSTLASYDSIFASAIAAGITITCAAGDAGAKNGTNALVTDFPASSPNVIACGGTNLVCPNFVYDAQTVETTWSFSGGHGTGGGISAFFKGPPYGNTSTTFRQVPDVSLVADPYTGVAFVIPIQSGSSYVDTPGQIVGGTSIVSPAIAALAACLPKAPKGLLSKIYSLPASAFHDITVGQNGGYSAGVGYDLCTGLGSINGANFGFAYTAALAAPVTGLTLPVSVSINGTPLNLMPTVVMPIANRGLIWFSSNNSIVSVTNGLLTGLMAGSATVTATTLDGFFTASTNVLVTAPVSAPAPSTTISILNNQSQNITQLSMARRSVYTCFISTNSNAPITWSSSNTSVATVLNGIIRTLTRSGTVIITATVAGVSARLNISVR